VASCGAGLMPASGAEIHASVRPSLGRQGGQLRRIPPNHPAPPRSETTEWRPPRNRRDGGFMGIIGTIIIGLIVGLIARFLKPGDDSMGWIMTILLGIGGALAATYGGQALGIYEAGQAAGFIGAVIGAVVLLIIYGVIKKN